MRRALTSLIALAFVASLASGADAATQCRDAKGKFIKCPAAAAAPAGKCRDKTTKKFAKCGAPNTESVPTKP
ncbi:hypothetical protein [Phenylobacterium aquaticum]|uniref:hypothetical protein n=1 Tax=Phenylobacterium aquaticum TaxID=1763816 RepID=UPI0026F2BAD8|nr:hypothetical protein [Phenylobacterium aquaticum]